MVVDAIELGADSPMAGQPFKLNVTVRNQGDGPSESTTLRYYRSADSTVTREDEEVGTVHVSGLDPSASSGGSIDLTAPSKPGTYYYRACVDPVSGESDTANNCSDTVAIAVVPHPPDMVVDAIELGADSPMAGQPFKLNVTVRNQGDGPSESTTLRYYRSADSTVTREDEEVGTVHVSGLDPSASSGGSIDLTAPSKPGTYYYRACVDPVSGESDTANNCSDTVAIAPVATVISLDVTGPNSLTSVGETALLSVTANMSDGSSLAVENALVRWNSSDLAVATVSEGVVIAVGGGNATITASYEEHTAEVVISVWISTLSEGSVRVLYVIPADRGFRTEYSRNIARAIADVQGWYRRQLDGLTFEIYSVIPEPCHLPKGEDYYSHGDVWAKVLTDVQSCAPVRQGDPLFTWVLFVDASELGHCGEPHELGRGGDGLAMLTREDLELMQTPGTTHVYCDIGAYARSYGSVLGGLAHELAHTLDVPHPPGCDPWDPVRCDDLEYGSLMHLGYVEYPETYLLPSDKEILIRSPFFLPIREPLSGPPADLGLDSFYEKHLDAGGLPIVASSDVPDAALYRARDIVEEMLAHSDDLRATMARQGFRVAIMASSSVLSDLPEFSDFAEFSPGVTWDERTRGGGVGPTPQRPLMAIATENLLCYRNDVFPYEDIFVHEFAHAVLTMGVLQGTEGGQFRRRLAEAYQDALAAGLWSGTYAAENIDEYWAEGVQSWFDLNDPPGFTHNEINTRAELEAYDPVLAGLIREVFVNATISTSCHEVVDIQFDHRIQGVVVGPEGQRIQGVGLWAWQGKRYNSGYGVTGPDGTFEIRVPEGSFTLDIYAECMFVGWYGPGGFTDVAGRATLIHIDGASVSDIEIRLPKEPIEYCS